MKVNRLDLQALLKSIPRKDRKFEFRRRIKFSMSKKKLKSLLDDLDGCNRELERFTDKSERLEPFRATSNSKLSYTPPLPQIRTYAKSLYDVLCSGRECHTFHRAKLQLDARITPAKRKSSSMKSRDASSNEDEALFKASLYVGHWQDIHIRIPDMTNPRHKRPGQARTQSEQLPSATRVEDENSIEISKTFSSITSANGSLVTHESLIKSSIKSSPGQFSKYFLVEKLKAGVSETMLSVSQSDHESLETLKLTDNIRVVHEKVVASKVGKFGHMKSAGKGIAWANSSSGNFHETKKQHLKDDGIAVLDLEDLEDVVDICTAVRNQQGSQACLSFCFDYYGKLRGVYTNPVSNTGFPCDCHDRSSSITNINKVLSLDTLLSGSTSENGCRMSRKDRMALAVTLASSYLQLETTPWLKDSWGKSDIVFETPSSNSNQQIDVKRAFVISSVESRTVNAQSGSQQTNGNYCLLALGILLLELSTGQSFERRRVVGSTQENRDPAQQSVERLMKLAEASKWLSTVEDDLSNGFLLAIRHCIRSYFDGTSGKDEAGFRQAVLDQVVLPLQEDLQSFLGHRAG
jgi:hypothetical protein